MPVAIACVLSADEVQIPAPSLIVFPEGVAELELHRARSLHPEAMIIGAVKRIEAGTPRSIGVVVRGERLLLSYRKITTDGITIGTGKLPKNPTIVQNGEVAVGVLVCMDLDHPEARANTLSALHASSAGVKVLCVPADMGVHWFSGSTVPFAEIFSGIHLVLCNQLGSRGRDGRCQSFISDTNGMKVIRQQEIEPMFATLPFSDCAA